MLKWNGDLLNLKQCINYKKENKNAIVYFCDGTKCYITRRINVISLIADEIKTLFGLEKIGRNGIYVKGNDYTLHKIKCKEGQFDPNMSNLPLDDIKKVYIYRWALGLTKCYDSSLWVRCYNNSLIRITSFVETDYDYSKCNISALCINKWFGDWNHFDEYAAQILSKYTYSEMWNKLYEIVKRIDINQIGWINMILERIAKYLN